MEINIKEINWLEAQEEVKKVNPAFYDIIEKSQPTIQHTLYRVKYNFGDLITDNGMLNLPTSHRTLVPLSSNKISDKIKSKISYRSIPLFMVLQNSCEVFVEMETQIETRTVPLNLFYPGSLLGLFETHDLLTDRPSDPLWTVSAGARNLFMLPSLASNQGINRLRRYYDFPVRQTPNHLQDHWEFFKGLINSSKFEQKWCCEILIFSETWLDTSKPELYDFQRYLFGHSWRQSQYAMQKVRFSFIWQIFLHAIYKRHIKLRPYLADTIKHLLLIASKEWTGFCPADDSQRIAPTTGLQQAILEIYQLKNHFPTIMHATPLAEVNNLFPVYYSLSYPSLLEGEPERGVVNRIMPDLRELKMAIDTLFDRISQKEKIKLKSISDIAFGYFHNEDDMYNEIRKASEIIKEDSRFLPPKQFANRSFCDTSIFWRGCIQLSKK